MRAMETALRRRRLSGAAISLNVALMAVCAVTSPRPTEAANVECKSGTGDAPDNPCRATLFLGDKMTFDCSGKETLFPDNWMEKDGSMCTSPIKDTKGTCEGTKTWAETVSPSFVGTPLKITIQVDSPRNDAFGSEHTLSAACTSADKGLYYVLTFVPRKRLTQPQILCSYEGTGTTPDKPCEQDVYLGEVAEFRCTAKLDGIETTPDDISQNYCKKPVKENSCAAEDVGLWSEVGMNVRQDYPAEGFFSIITGSSLSDDFSAYGFCQEGETPTTTTTTTTAPENGFDGGGSSLAAFADADADTSPLYFKFNFKKTHRPDPWKDITAQCHPGDMMSYAEPCEVKIKRGYRGMVNCDKLPLTTPASMFETNSEGLLTGQVCTVAFPNKNDQCPSEGPWSGVGSPKGFNSMTWDPETHVAVISNPSNNGLKAEVSAFGRCADADKNPTKVAFFKITLEVEGSDGTSTSPPDPDPSAAYPSFGFGVSLLTAALSAGLIGLGLVGANDR